jgi:membrane-associated phospholipid phosphatase
VDAPREIAREVGNLDIAVYAAIATAQTPALDDAMRWLSNAASYSRLSIAGAGALALFGGRRGREAACYGLASVALTSLAANLVVKPLTRRRRPDRAGSAVPVDRYVTMPTTRSFPSGHTASAFAFATGVSDVLPLAGPPLALLATAVGYSRVHSGVHYPSDTVGGALLGVGVAQMTTYAIDRRRQTRTR